MKRLITVALVLMLALLLVVLAAPVAAQSSDWSLYMYESTSHQLIRVNLSGQAQYLQLNLPADATLDNSAIDFTPDGQQIAYCDLGKDGDQYRANLNYGRASNDTVPNGADLGFAQGCWPKYSPDGSQIAVGLVHHFAGDPNADASQPAWELLVINPLNGQQLHALKPSMLPAFSAQTIMPEVLSFTDTDIIFVALSWGTEGTPLGEAYDWNLNSNSVQPIDHWAHSGLDSLGGTGELAWTELDASKPAAQPNGPVPQANVVKMAYTANSEYAVYYSPDWLLLDTRFINNGRQLAIEEVQGGAINPGDAQERYDRLDRDGSTYDLAEPPAFAQLAGAPNGYVILWASDNTSKADLTLEYHTATTDTKIWEQPSDGGSWSMLWTAPTQIEEDLRPFMTVNP